MAAGVPVVASDIPAYRAVLDDGKLGRLVPPGDPEALADGLLAVPARCRSASRSDDSGLLGVEMFAWPRVASDILTAYRDCDGRVGRSRPPGLGGGNTSLLPRIGERTTIATRHAAGPKETDEACVRLWFILRGDRDLDRDRRRALHRVRGLGGR